MITEKYLDENPDIIFVYGDNLIHQGLGGAAALRYHPQSYGFITKKYPNYKDSSYYTPEEYLPVFQKELEKLVQLIENQPDKTFAISKLGSNLANKFGIYEAVIKDGLEELRKQYINVELL